MSLYPTPTLAPGALAPATSRPDALLLIGHGSLRSASGASMIRLAARLRERGSAPRVEAAFLNYSRPTLAEVVAKLTATGLAETATVVIQPYFLIAGAYVQHDLTELVAAVAADFPRLRFALAPVLGEHPALTDLAFTRLQAALPTDPAAVAATHLLLMAHGTPLPAANAPLTPLAVALQRRAGLASSAVAYLDCNTPSIPDALDALAATGAARIIAQPYFLHLGRHVAEDLPALIAAAQQRWPATAITLAHHLDYDLRLADAIHALAAAAQPLSVAVLATAAVHPDVTV